MIKQHKQQLEDSKDKVRTEIVKFIKDHEVLIRDVHKKKYVVVYESREKLQLIREVGEKEELILSKI